MVKHFCDRCDKEMPTPKKATDNSCLYYEFKRNGDIEIHLAYRTLLTDNLQGDVCPQCLLEVLQAEIKGLPPQSIRRILND